VAGGVLSFAEQGGAGRLAGPVHPAGITSRRAAMSAAREFRDPEIIVVDSAFAVDPGSHSCHNTPQKPDQPR